MQQLQEKAALLIGNQKALWEKSKKMPAEEFFAKQRSLETSLTQLQTKLSELGGFLAKHEESLQEVAQLKKEGNDRWQKSTKALLAINNRLKQTGQEHQELKDSVREQIGAMSDKLVKFQEFYVVNAVSAPSHEEGNLSAIKEEIIAKTRKLEEKITNLEEQNQLLYGRVKDFKEGESIPEISSLQKELQSLKEHAEKESQTLHQKMQALNEEHTKTVQELRGRLEEINKTVAFSSSDIEGSDQIQQELKKRDEEIAKLKRRVLYLYKNAHEDSEGKTSNNQIDERFEALKKDMESRISEHLEKTHNDKQAIEMLLKKVAELQALLPVKDLRDSVQ